MESTKKNVMIKQFIGCKLTPNLEHKLNQNTSWKNETISLFDSILQLETVQHQKKEYLGFYITDKFLTLEKLKHYDDNLRKLVQLYCPECNIDAIKISIFPQTFVQ